jgi:hypothetical protein
MHNLHILHFIGEYLVLSQKSSKYEDQSCVLDKWKTLDNTVFALVQTIMMKNMSLFRFNFYLNEGKLETFTKCYS